MKQEVTAKKVFIRTLGCQMNEYDSELIRGLFEQEGYVSACNIDEGDVIIFNTCAVREHAESRVWGQAGMLAKIKEQRAKIKSYNNSPNMTERQKNVSDGCLPQDTLHQRPIIAICGCMAQSYQEEIFKRLPQVDIVCGTGDIYDLPKLVERVKSTRRRCLAVNGSQRPHAIGGAGIRKNQIKAFVTIIEGCDNYCSYCIVPYVRGRQVSREPDDILTEVKSLADNGTKEVTLLGQNVNSYAQDFDRKDFNFINLLEKISLIKNLKRVRFMTNHPKDTNEGLFRLMGENKKICPHLHLPLQSGSDRILKTMNRNYTAGRYFELTELYRKFVKDGSLTTDIIVGYPGENEEDFKATMEMMKKINFDSAFIFKYSHRKLASASFLPDDVPIEEKKERNQILLDLQKNISLNKNMDFLGREVEILADGFDKAKGKLTGRTPQNKKAVFEADSRFAGEVIKVKISAVTEKTLIGKAL